MPEATPSTTGYGLQNLARLCAQNDRAQWPGLIHDHFDHLFRLGDDSDFLRTVRDFDRARALLRVKLLSDAEASDEVHQTIAPGVASVLALDRPDVVTTVSHEDVASWKLPQEALFAIGVANVRADGPLEAHEIDRQGGDRVTVLTGPTYYGSTHALFLEDYLTPASPHGALVAVPERHTVVFHQIRDLSVVPAVTSVLLIAQRRFEECPGAISRNLYWWRAGRFVLLPSRFEGGKLEFAPPDEFIEALNAVPPPPTA